MDILFIAIVLIVIAGLIAALGKAKAGSREYPYQLSKHQQVNGSP
ncbi:hypothetical protein FHR99_003141 [Litorivivens lipolytica]|uniref:Tumour necrosis factor receptor superfamily member 19 n=1 Tax=Litorivivens lipolytica TaxID=1524264 RepID=A0A7W4W8P4_9GAMM|nr:hypothetical protein [Litorivivens lipolytica]